MTKERQHIEEDFYVGDHKNIRDTVYDKNGALYDLTGAEITFYMFDKVTGEVYITKSSNKAGEIDILDQVTNEGELVVYLLPSDTLRQESQNDDLDGTFRYHIKCIDASGNGSTVTTGRINVFASPGYHRYRNVSQAAYLAGQ